jgi:hypothetical protein
MSRKLKKIMSIKNIGERNKKLSEYLASLGGTIYRFSSSIESITEKMSLAK